MGLIKKTLFLVILGATACAAPAVAQEAWYPFRADFVEPAFADDGIVQRGFYQAYPKASQRWKICVSIPHLKDDYWNAVNYGIAKEAERLNVRLNLYEAGGYENLDIQIRQIEECVAGGADGLVLSAVDFDRLNPTIDDVMERGIPVVDLINGVSSTNISARSVRPYYDLAFLTGEFLADLLAQEGWADRPARIAWFPGPQTAGWAQSGNEGLQAALAFSPAEIVSTLFGDTGRTVQADLIYEALEEHGDVDFIIGTSVTAEAAMRIVNERGLRGKTRVLSYYFSPGVYRGILRGIILGSPSDNQAIQARIAMDQIVRILEGAPYRPHVAAQAAFLNDVTIEEFDTYTSLAPAGFRPVFVIN